MQRRRCMGVAMREWPSGKSEPGFDLWRRACDLIISLIIVSFPHLPHGGVGRGTHLMDRLQHRARHTGSVQ